MSEHQYVAFRAIDGPVSDANLEYMQRQSSRAEITPWAFDNEYHYGSFRGNTYEMLRRGYDIHLRYANYGTRSLYIRLPHGLPDARAATKANDLGSQMAQWLQEQPPNMKDKWLAQLMSDSNSAVRRTILAEFQKSRAAPGWPTVNLKRTIAELQAAEDKIQQDMDAARSKKAAREKAKRLARMAADPTPILRETEELAEQRHSYEKVGKLLTELREALAGTDQAALPELQAQKLRKEHPTLKLLISALRRAGFLAK